MSDYYSGYGFLFKVTEVFRNETAVMMAQLREYAKTPEFYRVNFMVRELYLKMMGAAFSNEFTNTVLADGTGPGHPRLSGPGERGALPRSISSLIWLGARHPKCPAGKSTDKICILALSVSI